MAVKIRMKRVGAKNAPVFRIVVADSRSPRDGKFIEEIGTYLPLQKGDNVKINVDLGETPIAMEQGVRFAIREGGRTVGAGVVTKIIA